MEEKVTLYKNLQEQVCELRKQVDELNKEIYGIEYNSEQIQKGELSSSKAKNLLKRYIELTNEKRKIEEEIRELRAKQNGTIYYGT